LRLIKELDIKPSENENPEKCAHRPTGRPSPPISPTSCRPPTATLSAPSADQLSAAERDSVLNLPRKRNKKVYAPSTGAAFFVVFDDELKIPAQRYQLLLQISRSPEKGVGYLTAR